MVSIFMATYNGEKYLEAQLESIFNQTYQDFFLYIRDDYSIDSTMQILDKWKALYPDKIEISQRESNSGKPQIPFLEMVVAHKTDSYYMFCDQDDVWFPDKIEVSIKGITEFEKQYGVSTPILLGTEYLLTDQNLVPFRKQKKRIDYDTFSKANKLICYNIFTGCTIIFNRALSEKITLIPDNCVLHDWLLAFVASSLGVAAMITTPTLFYRQHSSNAVGSELNRSLNYYIKRFRSIWSNDYYHLANLFLQYYSQCADLDKVNMISTYAKLPEISWLKKIQAFFTYNYWAPGVIRKVYQLFR